MRTLILGAAIAALLASGPLASARPQDRFAELDRTVQAFLDRHRGTWQDLNVPEADGRVLHNLILKHKYARALEIGTSTGHSGVWMAWALAKTGGRLTTVEIDPDVIRRRSRTSRKPACGLHRCAARRCAPDCAGASGAVRFRLLGRRQGLCIRTHLVAVWPKLVPGGCSTAHNVSARVFGGGGAANSWHTENTARCRDDDRHLEQRGISISYKRGQPRS